MSIYTPKKQPAQQNFYLYTPPLDNNCYKHTKQLFLVCSDCHFQPMCIDCLSLGLHENHRIKQVKKANTYIDIQLSQWLVKLKNRIDLHCIDDERLRIKRLEFNDRYKTEIKQVKDRFIQYSKQLNKKKEVIMLQLQKIFGDEMEKMQKEWQRRKVLNYSFLQSHNLLQKISRETNDLLKCAFYHQNYQTFKSLHFSNCIFPLTQPISLNVSLPKSSTLFQQIHIQVFNPSASTIINSTQHTKPVESSYKKQVRKKNQLTKQEKMISEFSKGIRSCKQSPYKQSVQSKGFQHSNPSSPLRRTISRNFLKQKKTQQLICILNDQKRDFNRCKKFE